MERRLWKIVGGGDRGGVLVREGRELASAKAPERLSTGALVLELELLPGLVGDRLHYRRLTGTGPYEGWITVELESKRLAERADASEADGLDLGAPGDAMALMDADCEDAAGAGLAGEDGGGSADDDADAHDLDARDEDEAWEADAAGKAFASLPTALEGDLKWFVWNQVWKVVNAKIASTSSSTLEREVRINAAQADAERIHMHYAAAHQKRIFTRRTLQHLKRQAEVVGDATVVAIREGKWLLVTKAKALDRPDQLHDQLWSDLAVALRSIGVAIFFSAKGSPKFKVHQEYFKDRWDKLIQVDEE